MAPGAKTSFTCRFDEWAVTVSNRRPLRRNSQWRFATECGPDVDLSSTQTGELFIQLEGRRFAQSQAFQSKALVNGMYLVFG
jgi:hypothetical protein